MNFSHSHEHVQRAGVAWEAAVLSHTKTTLVDASAPVALAAASPDHQTKRELFRFSNECELSECANLTSTFRPLLHSPRVLVQRRPRLFATLRHRASDHRIDSGRRVTAVPTPAELRTLSAPPPLYPDTGPEPAIRIVPRISVGVSGSAGGRIIRADSDRNCFLSLFLHA